MSGPLERLTVSADALAPHHGRGALVHVYGLDLIEVADVLARDDAARLRAWMTVGRVTLVDDETWSAWSAREGARFEAVVVQPFVLVRPLDPG